MSQAAHRGHFPGYDILAREGEVKEALVENLVLRDAELTIEVKADHYADDTGLHFVEFEDRYGQPSGIRTCTASYWCVALDNGAVVMVPTERVRALAEEAIRMDRIKRTRWSTSPTKGALVSLEDLVCGACQANAA
jgi:hypothetical protein